MLDDLNKDPWGAVYKAVFRKIKTQLPVYLTKVQYFKIKKAIDDLFPSLPTESGNFESITRTAVGDIDVNPLTIEEVLTAIKGGSKTRKNTAPGPDGVSKEILKAIPKECYVHFDVISEVFVRRNFPNYLEKSTPDFATQT